MQAYLLWHYHDANGQVVDYEFEFVDAKNLFTLAEIINQGKNQITQDRRDQGVVRRICQQIQIK